MKPIEELTRKEALRVNLVIASPIVSDGQHQSWDVELYSVADPAPIASNACTLDVTTSFDHIDGYTTVMLQRVGLKRSEPWTAGETPGTLTARVSALPPAPAELGSLSGRASFLFQLTTASLKL